MTGKSNWFRKVRQADDGDEERAAFYSEEQENKPKGKANSPRRDQQERIEGTDTTRPREELRVTSVLFVEQSKRGTLASKMRETLRRLEPLLGFRMKVVENAGTSLGTLLSNRDPWAGTRCGRESCFPCKQKTERIEDCKKANILYESRCCTCNGEEKGKTSLELDDPREHPSIYVGESARTLQERSREHHSDYSKQKEESHMLKHWSEAHRGEEKPRFNQFVISSYKSCLERQIGEAVRIQLRGNVLNSVGVYNRSKLTRLVVDSDWDKRVFNSNWTQDNKDILDIIEGGETEESIEEKEN